MSIRRAEEKDVPRIMDLLAQVLMVHHEGRPDLFKAPATKYTEEELRALLRDDTRPIFAWTDEKDELVGYCFCVLKQELGNNILTDIKTLYIDDLCVDERARGKGVGRALYDYVKDYARSIGCYNLTLNVWARNEAALRFYRGLGMQPQKYGMETIL